MYSKVATVTPMSGSNLDTIEKNLQSEHEVHNDFAIQHKEVII